MANWECLNVEWGMDGKGDFAPIPHSPFVIPHSRPGISLLEVLISMFILTVGLLSIATLLPVGSFQVQKAGIEDRKSTIGQNAFNEFRTRGMANPQKWLHFLNPSSAAGQRVITNSGRLDNDLREYVPLSVAIDPLCVTNPSTGGQISKLFPRLRSGVTSPDGRPRMPRLSLTQSTAGVAQSMTQAVAQQIFMAQDDTVFEKQSDPDAPPVSKWEESGGQRVRRQFEGNFSWLVTLTPAYFNIEVPAPVTKYNISIAIFFKRVLATRVNESNLEHERMVDVSQSADLAGFGLGGGELILNGDQNATPQENEANTALKPGQWVLVCGRYQVTASPPTFASVFRWYRVVTVGEYDSSSNRGQRPVTLAGPDWMGVTDPDPNNWRCKPTHVAVFEGCVGVFEKTVHLEGPSVWSN